MIDAVLKYPHTVKARKQHRCDYCGKLIAIGEEYTKATYKADHIYDWRSCERCKEYVEEAFHNNDYDFSDGMGWQDFMDYMSEEHRDIAAEWWKKR